MNETTIICHNDGRVTLQIEHPTREKYQHTYDTAHEAAPDMLDAIEDDNCMLWDENQTLDDNLHDAWLTISEKHIRNGHYKTFVPAQLLLIHRDTIGWANVLTIYDALKTLPPQSTTTEEPI